MCLGAVLVPVCRPTDASSESGVTFEMLLKYVIDSRLYIDVVSSVMYWRRPLMSGRKKICPDLVLRGLYIYLCISSILRRRSMKSCDGHKPVQVCRPFSLLC